MVTLVDDAPAGSARTAVPAHDAAHALIEAELRWSDAVQRGDREIAGSFMAADFTSVTAGTTEARVDRAAWLACVSVPSTLEAFAYEDFRIRVIHDVALVVSRCRERGRWDTAGDSTTFRFTDVWQREDGRWRIGLRRVGLS